MGFRSFARRHFLSFLRFLQSCAPLFQVVLFHQAEPVQRCVWIAPVKFEFGESGDPIGVASVWCEVFASCVGISDGNREQFSNPDEAG